MSLLQQKLEQRRKQQQEKENSDDLVPVGLSKKEVWRQVKERTMQEVIKSIDIDTMDSMQGSGKSAYISKEVGELVDKIVDEMEVTFTKGETHRLIGELVSEIIGYGPITSLLADPSITEIMVNGPQQVFIEKKGRLELANISFKDDNHLLHIIERIVAPLGKRIDESSPMVDARLPDGSRVNATVPPISLDGPTITIRKFSETPFTMNDLIQFGTLTPDMAVFIRACVEGKQNIVVGGGTGSGKTSTLNVLSSFIPYNERIVTIEDAAELQLLQDHVVRLEARPANIEGKGKISIRDLVINSLRMRPDRIVVGEVRGGEALDMLQAMNTGHDGSLTTGHANSPRDLLSRLETMVLMAGVELPLKAIREQIASAVNLIIFQARMRDGSRKITNISEVLGMEGDVIILQKIFVFDERGFNQDGTVLGQFKSTGVIPRCLTELEARGIRVPITVFKG